MARVQCCCLTPASIVWVQSGCHTGSSFSNIARLPYQGCALLFQGLSEASTGRPTLAIKAPGFAGGGRARWVDGQGRLRSKCLDVWHAESRARVLAYVLMLAGA